MNWKAYRETRGGPGEVVIACAPEDIDAPWTRRRVAVYEGLGRRATVASKGLRRIAASDPGRVAGCT